MNVTPAQPLLVDIEMYFDTETAAQKESVKYTVDYAAIASQVRFLLRSCHFRLLETAAHALARLVLAPPSLGEKRAQVDAALVRLTKPGALRGYAIPTLEIHRKRDWCTFAQEEKSWGNVDILLETRDAGIYRLNIAPEHSIPLHVHRVMRESEMVLSKGLLCQGNPVTPGTVHRWPRNAAHGYKKSHETLAEYPLCRYASFSSRRRNRSSRGTCRYHPRASLGADCGFSMKRILITGASRGIGAAIASTLAQKGNRIVASGRDMAALRKTKALAPTQIKIIAADLSFSEERDQLVEDATSHLGGLDALINCAGILSPGFLDTLEEQDVMQTLRINLIAPLLLSRNAARHLKKESGTIVNIASTLGIRPAPGLSVYSASKAGLLSLTRTLAAELAPDVRVNAIAPGVVDTDMPRQLRQEPGKAPTQNPQEALNKQLEELRALHLLKRLGRPDEIAKAVIFCMESPWLTGTILPVDGGLLAV